MNAIQQISLKLQMGIDPAIDVKPELLRAMWRQLSRERYNALLAGGGKHKYAPATAARTALQRAG